MTLRLPRSTGERSFDRMLEMGCSMQIDVASAYGERLKGLPAPSTRNCPLFTVIAAIIIGKNELETSIHESLCPIAANKMEPIVL